MRIIFLISAYFSSGNFRHYLSKSKQNPLDTVSLRCHRDRKYWQQLTKRPVTIMGISIPIWQWLIVSDRCSIKDMRRHCSKKDRTLAVSTCNTLKPAALSTVGELIPIPETVI